MSEASTIATFATAGGTLALAVATFSATRSANRAARATERALQIGLRPVLFNARPHDPPQKVAWVDGHRVQLRDGLAAVQEVDGNIYLAIPLRNVASGLAVLHGWYVYPDRVLRDAPPEQEDFRRLTRDLYVPAGDISFWQGALRDPGEAAYAPMREAIGERRTLSVDILYGDHEGGQLTVTRFSLTPRTHPTDDQMWMWMCTVSRHWYLDRADPR